MLVPLQGAAAARVVCALWSGHAGAAAGCCLRVRLSGWCVRFEAVMVAPLAQGAAVTVGAAAGCCCQSGVLFGAGTGAAVRDVCVLGWACWCRVPLQGVAARCCLEVNGVCALERACSCRPRRHAATACCLRVLLSEWCVRFGVACRERAWWC